MTGKEIIDSAVCLDAADGSLLIDPWMLLASKWGIRHAIVAPMDAMVAVDNEAGNAATRELVRQRPAEFSALAVANPWYGGRALEMLNAAFDAGAVGLYLHPGRQGFRLSDAVVDPLIAVCADRDKPVYVYTGTPVCSEPFQLAELARRFPRVTFVMGHMAWSDFSGYDAVPAARQAPNIVIESSCTVASLVQAAIDELGAERVLFGSGYPRSRPGHEIAKLHELRLSPRQRALFLHDNARRIWRIL